MTKNLGQIIEKGKSLPEICCRFEQFEIKLCTIAQLVQHCFCSFLEQSHTSKTKYYSV